MPDYNFLAFVALLLFNTRMLKRLINRIGRAVGGQKKKEDVLPSQDINATPVAEAPLASMESLDELQKERQHVAQKRRSPRSRQLEGSAEVSEPAANSEQAPRKTRRRKRKRKTSWSIEQFQVPEKEGETRFHDLGLPDPIMHAIADLGFQYCTPIQSRTLVHANAGQNIAGRAQTGTGKTAAFLISIFHDFLKHPLQGEQPMGTPRALVLAPTRELVIQIADDAQALSKYCPVNAMAVYGGMDLGKQKDKLERRAVDMIVATPGRLLDFMQRGNINLKKLEVLVIDEADRMLDMGFIPDVKQIIRQTPAKNKRRTMLFSATLTEDVLRLASQWMPDPVICEMSPEQVTVDTIDQIVYIVTSHQKFKVLYHLLQKRRDERVLIFCNRRDNTHRLANKLANYGINCEQLSGAIPQKKRLKILEAFKEGSQKVVVATDVAGRGLHVQDIGLVINYEFPYDPEDYVHRIGRTGRAGVSGTAISFACEDESFAIPEIEKYIGVDLRCRMPDEEMLTALPVVNEKQTPPQPRPQSHRAKTSNRRRRPSQKPRS